MRTSQFYFPTLRESPADAELISHQLMLRAGMIRKLASGLYTWLPLGLRVIRKIEAIVREELTASGALEVLMPAIQPAELWQTSHRWDKYGKELLKLHDRHARDFCFGPTHEEVITDLIRGELKSYKQLPKIFFQIQTKFRDEIRPRFGVMRAREFIMKDAYSFDIDEAGLQQSYDLMNQAYHRIFERLGLQYRSVLADNGSIGGKFSQEFHVLAASGEDQIFYSDGSDYAANVEYAQAWLPELSQRPAPSQPLEKVSTPGQRTIAAVSEFLGIPRQQQLKALFVKGREHKVIALFLRGDHELNTLKAEKHPLVASPLEFAEEADINAITGCKTGYLGPVGLSIPIIVDYSAAVLADFVCGANEDDTHLKNVNWGRDCPEPEVADLRNVIEGDLSPDGKGKLCVARGIEVGHIFQLGTTYSEALEASVLDPQGKKTTLQMGCYGIGVSRIVAAAIEQNHDEHGIIWSSALTPFDIVIIPMNMKKSPELREQCEKLYRELTAQGFAVLLDDRDERAGVMFADMDLIGIPQQVIMSDKHLANGEVEYKLRRNQTSHIIKLNNVIATLHTNI
ncbi:MAG: proline--tRNA ligase [Gammaproteobacteria bacterium]